VQVAKVILQVSAVELTVTNITLSGPFDEELVTSKMVDVVLHHHILLVK